MTINRRALVGLIAVAPVILLTLHGLAITPLVWQDRALDHLVGGAGKQFVEPLGTMWMSRYQVGESPAVVMEDGVPLPCPNTPPEAIAEFGGGAYMVADGRVYLSATDNSDPRSNGRRYTMRWPAPPPVSVAGWFVAASLLAAMGVGLLLWEWRRRIGAILADPPLALAFAIVIVPFALHRAWPTFEVPLPGVQPDTRTYYALVRDLFAGRWPHFEQRPPGYPLFLALSLKATNSLVAIIWIQTLASLVAALVLVIGVHRLQRKAAPWAALAMAAALTNVWVLQHDTSILSESPYASAMVLAFGFLCWALGTGSPAVFVASSVSFALVIFMRPAGIFLVVPFVLTVIHLWRSGRSRRATLGFAIPFPVLMLALSLYNWNVSNIFGVTGWGEANIAAATFVYWEPDPAYPPEINQLVDVTRTAIQVNGNERELLQRSWSPKAVAPIYAKSFNLSALQRAMNTGGDYAAARRWLRRISFDSIGKHPDLYAKFVVTMAYLYFVDNIRWRSDYVEEINGRSLMLLTADGRTEMAADPLNGDLVARYFRGSEGFRFKSDTACAAGGAVGIVPTTARRVHRAVQRIRDLLFARVLFSIAAAVTMFLACRHWVVSRGRDAVAHFVVMLGLSVIGSGLIVCLVEYAGHRYYYPTEFAIYVMLALAPWLGRSSMGARSNPAGE